MNRLPLRLTLVPAVAACFSGYSPDDSAARAAELNPIEALRYE